MRHYIIYAERQTANINVDNSETITITAKNLWHAIMLGRRLCRHVDLKFIYARFVKVA